MMDGLIYTLLDWLFLSSPGETGWLPSVLDCPVFLCHVLYLENVEHCKPFVPLFVFGSLRRLNTRTPPLPMAKSLPGTKLYMKKEKDTQFM